jgi:plasmid stabilization system protein ParE
VLKPLILTRDAQKDLDYAFQWYEDQAQGLGRDFIRCVDARFTTIQQNPFQYQVVFKDTIQRALVSRFPFALYFINESDALTVFVILHQRRDSRSWQSRM